MPTDPISTDQMQKLIESASISFPTAIAAVIGSAGLMLTSNDPKIVARHFVGGLLLSGFIGWIGSVFLMSIGFPGQIAGSMAAVLGASGLKGYEFLLYRVQNTVGGEDKIHDKL